MQNYQLSLPFIQHEVGASLIPQRIDDGYINATDMCKVSGKLIADYLRLSSTKAFLSELESDMGIPISELIQIVKGNGSQGTWIHPNVAINLGQWLSPKFAVMVTKWVHDWMSGKSKSKTELPPHIARHQLNIGKIPIEYFSVLQEMTLNLVAPLEAQGYTLPKNLMPDISQAKLFCKHLRANYNINTDVFNTYNHEFPDGRVVKAKLYPVELVGIFRQLMTKQWLPQAVTYFKSKDPNALPALDRLLQITYNKTSSNSSTFKINA